MKIFRLLALPTLLLLSIPALSQSLPQQQINDALSDVWQQPRAATPTATTSGRESSGVLQLMRTLNREQLNTKTAFANLLQQSQLIDTIAVGLVPNDTLVITGTFFNNGPIIVLNDGVLIFHNSNATILGDLILVNDAQMWADSSTLLFPQLYFYQRGWIVVNNAEVHVNTCTLDFSGLSHSMAVSDNGAVFFQGVINNGFTTAGAYANGTISIDSTNQAGEFIMSDSASLSFNNANVVLLWHHLPSGSVVNTAFPPGASVASYTFNNSLPNVSGVYFDVSVANSTDVWWGLMPVNGSDVTINNSTLRTIGAWFTQGDTISVSGLVNNSNYTSFTAPLSDRNLQLNNCSVQTWSLYIFDSSSINVTGCIIGELGTLDNARCNSVNVFCDGSGGYFWSSGQSFCVAIGSSVSSYVRSERNSILLYGYGTVNGGASALNESVLITVQSNLPADPVANEAGTAWMINLNAFPTSFVDSSVSINGSAWIDQGPLSSGWMDLDSYRLWYSPALLNPPVWTPIGPTTFSEVRNNLLGTWNTQGLSPGTYSVRLNTFNTLGDSVEAVRQITLLPSVVGLPETKASQFYCFPANANAAITINFPEVNESGDIVISSVDGKVAKLIPIPDDMSQLRVDVSDLAAGTYIVSYNLPQKSYSTRFVKN